MEKEKYDHLTRDDLIEKLRHYKKLAFRNLYIQPP